MVPSAQLTYTSTLAVPKSIPRSTDISILPSKRIIPFPLTACRQLSLLVNRFPTNLFRHVQKCRAGTHVSLIPEGIYHSCKYGRRHTVSPAVRNISIIDFSENGNPFFYIYFFLRIASIYFPVYDLSFFATSSGVPHATIVPPLSPPSGPISMI